MTQDPQEPKKEQEAQEATQAQEDAPREITLDMSGYKPELDPGNPAFDAESYKKAIQAAGGIATAWESTSQQMQDALHRIITENIATAADTARAALDAISKFLVSDIYTSIKDSIATINAYYQEHKAEIEALADITDDARELMPFLQAELENLQQDPAFADATMSDLFAFGFDADGNVTDSPFRAAIERAMQRRAEYEAAKETIAEAEQAAEELPRIISSPTEKLTLPVDKVNSNIWDLFARAEIDGQIAMADIDTSNMEIDTTSDKDKKKGKKAIINCSILLGEIEQTPGVKVTKHLTLFDKRVMLAAGALVRSGNSIFTTSQLYRVMGYSGNPSAEMIERIDASMTKQRKGELYLNNTSEREVYKAYPDAYYDSTLLPFERVKAYINNTFVESAYHLFREPPLITFAREREQITEITTLLLQAPISKTEANLRLEDYLLERIGHMKSKKFKAKRKMLFTTIYKRCNITGKTEKDRKERQRTPGKIRKYLDHYVKCGWIKGYTMDKDSVTIHI